MTDALDFGAMLAGPPSEGRSSEWPRVEREFLKEHPTCEACGTKNDLNVHHVEPFHIAPKKELDKSNLITLCRADHFVFGHFHNWSSFNPNARRDVAAYRAELDHRPKGTSPMRRRELDHQNLSVILVPRDQLRARGRKRVRLADVRLPTPPAGVVDWTRNDSTALPILGNDQVGDCFYAALCHWVQLVTALRGTPASFSAAAVVARYRVLSGGDNGLSDAEVFPEFKAGIVGPNGPYRAWNFLVFDPRNLALAKVMLWRFGPLLYTAALADAWLDNARPGATWDAGTPDQMNGHAMVLGRENGDGSFAVETWGFSPPVRLTPGGLESCDPELIACLSPLWYDAKGYSPAGFHYTEDAALWTSLGGTAPPSPFPGPGPGPTPTGKMNLQLSLQLTPPHSLTGTYTLTNASGEPSPVGLTIPPEVYALLWQYVREYGLKAVAVAWPVVQADLASGRIRNIPADVWAAVKAAFLPGH